MGNRCYSAENREGKEDSKHAAQSIKEGGMDVILQNKGKEESRANLQQTRKEGIEDRRPSAE